MMLLPKYKKTRNREYLHWVKEQPCVVCGHPVCDPHHIKGYGLSGTSTKASDLTCIPLCRKHHTGDEGIHRDWKAWEREHGSQWKYVEGTLMRALRAGVL